MNARLLKISVVLMMMLLPVSMMAQITVAVDNTSTFVPTQIVNGDFGTRPFMPFKYNDIWYNTWNSSNPNSGYYWTEVNPNGIGQGWNTTETQLYDHGLFEWTNSMGTYNGTLNTNGNNNGHGYFLEMNACNSAVLYQDLPTHGHDVIRWSLQHAVRTGSWADPQSMRVEIGAPQRDGSNNIVAASGVNEAVDAKIIASTKATYNASGYTGYNGYSGDYSGLSLPISYDAQWYTVTGVYSIPQGQDVTRFAFTATSTYNPGGGNLLDNITFSTVFGNLSAHLVEGNDVELKGYWGESDAAKTMKVVIGSTTHTVNMSSVRGHSFTITIPAATIGSENALTVYHQDYYDARLTIYIAPTYSVELASGTASASDWSFSPTSAKSGLTVAINYNGTRTVKDVTVGRNITSTIEFNNSNASTAINNFNNTPRSKLLFKSNYTQDLTVTRSEGEIDLNGYTTTGAIFTQNNQYGYSLTIKNGSLKGVDGAVGWSNWYSGTLIFDNVTMSESLWTDGHDVIIKSGTYSYVQNYKKGDTPGTVTIFGGKIGAFNTDPTGASNAGASNGTYTLYGGKYKFDPRGITAYTVIIPTGYAVQSNNESDAGTYPYKVVNTDPSYAVEFENFHLTEVTHDHQWTFTMPPYDVMVAVTYTDFQGHGTETEPYLIPSTEAWNQLCANVKAGKPYTGKHFLQTEDITISERTATFCEYGPEDPYSGVMPYFEGIYDGGGFIMNLDIHETAGENKWIATSAPFGLVRNATFKNMHITGETSTNNMRPASLVGFSVGNNTIINCWSEVAISSTYNSDIDAGAFVARLGNNAHFDITGCLFTGSITYSNASGYEGGGFVGWTRTGSTVTLTDCVFAPSAFTFTKTNAFYMFVGGGASHGTINNCYYNSVAAAANLILVGPEKRISSVTGATGVTVTPVGTPTTSYDVSTIAIYGTNGGLSAGGVLYGKNADVVSMNLSGAEQYMASTGTLNGTENPYSLTMVAANSVISKVVASVTTSANVTTNYNDFSAALSAWESNSTLTLLADVETNSTITINNTRTLDLNGYGIKRTGTGRVILLNGSGNLTINDSNPDAEHKFTVTNAYGDAGLGVVNDELTSGYQTFHGGYITGGNGVEHGAGIENDATNGVVTINGGVFIGNRSTTHGGFYWGHTNKTLNMNGGRIIYNMTACQGAAIFIGNATMRLYGGEISHNYSTGSGRAHSGGICSAGNNNFYMHGAPIVTANIGGNSATNQPNDICLESMISIDGGMTNTTPIGIMMNLGGYDGTTRGQFSYDSEFIDNSTPGHFVGQNYGDDVPVRIGDALWMWNQTLDETIHITTLPTAITGLVYSGAAQALVNAGTATGGTMYYSLDNSTWSEDIPTATDAGTYTVYYKVVGDANHADFIPSPNTVEVYIDYTITYDLDGGSVASANPSHYNISTATFTLNNPTKTDYTFTGWTGTDLDEPTMTVSIANGSTGNRTYTATFALDEYRLDSIPFTWQVKIGDGNPFSPTPYVTENPTPADTMGYVMIPVGAEFFIIPSDEKKPLIKNLELIEPILYLSTVTTDTIVPNGWTVTGTLGENHKISIADGATVTLDNVVIQPIGYLEYEQRWAGITCLGDATIILKDGTSNTVKNFGYEETPGIFVPENNTLTIQGNTGSLSARGENGAAIGSGTDYSGTYASCGNIVINGGAINVQSQYGAGIGSGYDGSCGNIVINGGTITTSNHMGAGIGCGDDGSCGNINITGGTITTGSSESGAGIGSCGSGSCGDITISGGTVNSHSMYGAGIGCSDNNSGSCGTITISGGNVNAQSEEGAGIGGGASGSCGNIVINGGTVNARSEHGAGIGGGSSSACGDITITSGVTQVTATTDSEEGYHSIGKGYSSNACGTVTIGGTVYYDGSSYQNGGDTYLATKPLIYSAHYFSVSGTKQVIFALGNLQATYHIYSSNFTSWSWALATHQWDYIGNAAGNTSINGNGTASTNNVTVDLFGWVGQSSSWNSGAARYGISNSTTASNYGTGASEALKYNWGNTIGTGWRTLSSDEWAYLLNTRSTTSGVRYAKATVNSVNGVILLPDNWNTSYYSLSSTNTPNAEFTNNSVTLSDWTTILEAHGAIFLPTAGYRDGSTVNGSGTGGGYWSSTAYSSDESYGVFFYSTSLSHAGTSLRYYGRSVRLVRDAE